MSKRGENIYKRKDGRWEGRYVQGRDSAGKIQYGYIYGRTYGEVREKLFTAKCSWTQSPSPKNQIASPDPELHQDIQTFGTYCNEWLTLSRNRVKESTYIKYHNTIRHYIQPAFGFLQPQQLTAVCIESLSNSMLERGLSPKTVRDTLTILRSILNYCTCIGLTMPNTKIIYPKDQKKEIRILSRSEQTRLTQFLLTDLDGPRFGILLSLLTGMRIGEICALRWEDINLTDYTLHISSTMQRIQTLKDTAENASAPSPSRKTSVKIGNTKSYSSTRRIPLSPTAVGLCMKMRPQSGCGYVLTGQTDHFMEPRVLQYWLKKYTAQCGLDGIHFHTLRHTFATRCVEVGFDIKSLSEILGHASTRVTLDLYVHSSMELKRANIEKLTAIGL